MIELISKINDRNIQRKRESGLTGYVLTTALVLCVYKLYSHIEILLVQSNYSSENFDRSIELICYVWTGTVFMEVIFYKLFPNLNVLNNIKFLKPTKVDEYIIVNMAFNSLISLLLITYVFLTIEDRTLYFNIYGLIIFLLNVWGLFSVYLLRKENLSKELSINFEQYKITNLILLTAIIFSIIIATFSVIFAFYLQIDFKKEIVKIVLLSFITYFIILKMLEVNANDLFYNKLEAFEYDIRLRKLDDNVIRKEFQEKFSGFLVNEWIRNQKNLAEVRIKTYGENVDTLKSQIDEIDRKSFDDENLKIKLKNKIEEEIKLCDKKFELNIKEQILELEKSLNNNSSGFDDFERQQLNDLLKYIKKYFKQLI